MVTLTELDIVKMARSRLRIVVDLSAAATLSDLDATASAFEREVLDWYTPTLAELLEKVSWRPQTIDAELTLLDTDDGTQPWSGKWTYQYQYPGDCADLRAVRVPGSYRKLIRETEYDISQAASGETRTRVIFADFNPLNVEYVQTPDSTDVYGAQALFCKALSLRLALNVGPGCGVSDATLQGVKNDYVPALAEAMSKDANEAEPGDELPGDFVTARLGG